MRARPSEQVFRYAVLVLLTVFTLVPFVSLILASLHPPGAQISGLSLPGTWSVDSFGQAWTQGGFSSLMLSSALIAVTVVPLTIILATLAGYALAILGVRLGRAVTVTFVLGLALPVELIVVALYFNLRPYGLTNAYSGVILAEVALFLPFGVYWMQSHFSGMPKELVEAARLDGAADRTVLLRILLPNSGPALTTLAVLVFMWSWKQFLLILVMIQDPSMRTAPTGLGLFVGQYSTDIPLLAAATIFVIVPILVIYFLFQRNFVSGVTSGAAKG